MVKKSRLVKKETLFVRHKKQRNVRKKKIYFYVINKKKGKNKRKKSNTIQNEKRAGIYLQKVQKHISKAKKNMKADSQY